MTQGTEKSNTRDVFNTDEKDLDSGSNLPGGDGSVAPEQAAAVERGGVNAKPGKTGQDHSLENYGESEPDSGVGAVQDYSDTSSDIARIED
ncbi:MAG TPA: hypothetical protein VGC97_01140 [Pyrinomonadaceae bacterium]|jgi:hypothetical protein